MEKNIYLSSIFSYPIKSGPGMSLDEAQLFSGGLVDDRKWMVVDENGFFVTGREHPKLVCLPIHEISPFLIPTKNEREVQVWKDKLIAQDAHPEAQKIIRNFLGNNFTLVYTDGLNRKIRWQEKGTQAFNDGAPLLVLSDASIRKISEEAGLVYNELRFRPNLVFHHSEAFIEDKIGVLRFGDAVIELVDGCSRCDFTRVDPEQGLTHPSEPLASMKKLRANDIGVYLGANAIVRKPGSIVKGEKISFEWKRRGPIFGFNKDDIVFQGEKEIEFELEVISSHKRVQYLELVLGGEIPSELLAGSYIRIQLPLSGPRSYSITQKKKNQISLIVKLASKSSEELAQLGLSKKVKCLGFGGNFPKLMQTHAPMLWISGGSGLTPFLGLQNQVANGDSIIWIHSGRDAHEKNAILNNQRSEITFVHIDTSERSRLQYGDLQNHVLDLRDRVVLFCGPEEMKKSLKAMLSQFGVKIEKRLFIESYKPVELPEIEAMQGTIFYRGQEFKSSGNKTLLHELLDAGFNIPHNCEAGDCLSCKVKIKAGESHLIEDEMLSQKEKDAGTCLSCLRIPRGDMEIE